MTVIDLNPDAGTNPTRLEVATIERWMLWPEDEDREIRDRAQATQECVFGRELMRAGKLAPELIKELAERAVDAYPPEHLTKLVHARWAEGTIAGAIVYRALSRHELAPDRAAIRKVVEDISRKLWPQFRVMVNTIQTEIKPRFKRVAHFWAAYYGRAIRGNSTFPCDPRDLPEFLAEATEYRRLGETTKSHARAPNTILSRDEAIQLPPGFRLPKVSLEFYRAD